MHPKYQGVIQLRKRGKSYREISKITGISKSSISGWCKNLKLPLFAQKILEKKTKAVFSKLIVANKRKHKIVQAENEGIRKNAIKQVHHLSRRELLLVGATLYWGEGYKRQDKNRSPYISFVNSDPNMVRLFLRFLREVIQVPEERLRVNVRVHPNINEKIAIDFWSRITRIPKERFHVTHQISRASRGKRPINLLPYGTLKLDVSGRQNFFKIKGWIDGLKKQPNFN